MLDEWRMTNDEHAFLTKSGLMERGNQKREREECIDEQKEEVKETSKEKQEDVRVRVSVNV